MAITFYVDVPTKDVYNADGAKITASNAPRIIFREESAINIQYLNSPPTEPQIADPATLDKYIGFAGLTLGSVAVIDNNWDHYFIGAANAGYSGSVIAIAVKTLSSAPRAQTGTLVLINSAGQSESVAFTAYSLAGGVYTFTVSATLSYTYLANDVIRVSENPIIKTITADTTDQATGLFVVSLDGNSAVFQDEVSGAQYIADCKFAHILKNDDDDVISAFAMPFICENILDDDGAVPPAPADNYYPKVTSDIRYLRTIDALTDIGEALVDADDFAVYNASGSVNRKSALSRLWTWISGKIGAGNLTETTSSILTITGGTGATIGNVTIQVKAAATDQSGYLSSTDWNTFNGKQAALGFTPENVTNKSTDIVTDAASNTKYPGVKAIKDYADGLVVGLLDYRGAYDASVNTFPATGGSGTAGAILKGDMWVISVAGTLGGAAVHVGDSIIANADAPGQTAGNWNTLNANVAYVPEDAANKVTSLSGSSTDTQYPSAKLAYDQLALKADKTNVLEKDNVTEFTPSANYHPATKKYVDDSGDGLKNNFAAIIAPAVTDDTTLGYAIGSRWVDVVLKKGYTCVDATEDAAVWSEGGGSVEWLNGTGAPAAGLGKDGDYYINNSNCDVYNKVSGSWGSPVVNIKGATGETGLTGATGETPLFVSDSFDDGDLTSGVLTIAHTNGNVVLPGIIVDNNGKKIAFEDNVTFSNNSIAVDLSSFGTLTGTWKYSFGGCTPPITIYDKGNVTGAVTIDYNSGDLQTCVTTGNVTGITFSNLSSGRGIILDVDNTGGYSITFGGVVILDAVEASRYLLAFLKINTDIKFLGRSIAI